MPSFTTKYLPPGAYVQFDRDGLTPNASAPIRIPVIIGTGSTDKTTKMSLIRSSSTDEDSIGLPDVSSVVRIGNTEFTTDYKATADYEVADGVITWIAPGTAVVGTVTVNNLEGGGLSNVITASKSTTTVNDSYVIAVTVVGTSSTKGTLTGNGAMAASISVTETITVTIDGTGYTVALANGDSKATVLSKITTAIGSHGTAAEVSTNLKITSATVGTTSIVSITVASSTLRTELGVAAPVAVNGVTGTGRYTITPRSTRVSVTKTPSPLILTDIPGVNFTLTSVASKSVGEKAEVVTSADTVAKNPVNGATYYLTVISNKQDEDYELKYFYLADEEALYNEYGEPDPSTSTISTGGYVAFRNLADVIGVVQLQGGSGTAHFQAAIDKLLDKPIYYVVPLTSDPLVHAYVKNHVTVQSSTISRQERLGVVAGAAGYSVFDHIDSAKSLDDERLNYIVPSSWKLTYIKTDNTQYSANVNGSYAAVAYAVTAARQDAAEPMTRKTLSALVPLVNYNPTQMNQLAAGGCAVIETSGSVSRVRHQLTTDYNGPIESRELSIVQLRDYVSIVVRNAIEGEFVGRKILRLTPKMVESYTKITLDALIQQEQINDYSNVRAYISTVDPTEVDVEFEAVGIYPFNYGLIKFKLRRQAQVVA